MEQFDKWQEYWDKYLLHRHGKEQVNSEEDLFLQVAHTLNKRPIEKEVFNRIIELIIDDLRFEPDDILVDFCCGNGLFTYELKDLVKQIIAVDFSQSIIDTANKYKSAPNITYCHGSATEFLKDLKKLSPEICPTKYLMNDSLAYFSAPDLEKILSSIISISGNFKFLLRGVPNDNLKWNYYDTEERKRFYEELVAKKDLTNYGLGSWWRPDDILAVCNRLHLKCVINNQELPVSNYRMDIIISN